MHTLRATFVAIMLCSAAYGQSLLPIAQNMSSQCNDDAAVYKFQQRSNVIESANLDGWQSLPLEDPALLDFDDEFLARLSWWTATVLREPQLSEFFARRIFDQLMEFDGVDGASQVLDNRTHRNQHSRFLNIAAYAVLAIRETSALGSEQVEQLIEFLEARITNPNFSNDEDYEASRCFASIANTANVDRCDNDTLSRQHLRMLYGELIGDWREIERGRIAFQFAIHDMRSDGALHRDASKGAYSWEEYAQSLNHLLAIGDYFARRGEPLWDYQNHRGQTVHDIVQFYVSSVLDPSNPNLMLNYARNNLGVFQGRRYYNSPTSLELYAKVISRSKYADWLAIYSSWFPNSGFITDVRNVYRDAYLSRVPYSTGLNPWCVMPASW